ncbi:DUF1771-domain-containing protein [Trichodelitschia bisporula]|uniref:DUF1771-domain-containing protein n=1 Tax=Trichodelitschia bisporula TaxID=703511 RepID=A0A6G1HPQ1_9PEZI|nr:DUF1771-domain-containing protein [Trichodelitschia bisporula]
MSTAHELTPRAFNHAPDSSIEAEYDRLRSAARTEISARKRALAASHEAYTSGDGARAHALSQEGKAHGAKADQLNAQAAGLIFRENNAGGRVAGDAIDLHGLYVEEAMDILRGRIEEERRRGTRGLHVIVGKGNHSAGGVARIRPAAEEMLGQMGLGWRVEENEGRIWVDLAGTGGPMPPYQHGGGQGQYGGQHGGQQHGGQQHGGQQHGGQQYGGQHGGQQDNKLEEVVVKALPGIFKALKGCCVVM